MAASAESNTRQLYEFGSYRLDPEKALLLREDETVPIAPKAFQILLVLVRHNKQVVTKDDLMKSVWPDTFVEEANLSRNIFLLRKALGESPQDHQYIVTVPGRGYRFAEDVQLVPDRKISIIAVSHSKVEVQVKETWPWGWIAASAVLLIAAATGTWRLFVHHAPVLTEKDTIVLADFTNSTGDPVFDGTLRQGLAVQLEQSPFLNLISESRVQQTLRLMDKSADTRLIPDLAREICERTGSAAFLSGSIAQIGTQYLLTLKAARCSNGELLTSSEAQASDKNHVLDAVGQLASKMRNKLGESLSTSQKFDTPLEQATTPSLEALQAYTLGRRAMSGRGDWSAATPFFAHAVGLDPNFAIAYARLGMALRNLGEAERGAQDAQKAYQLRERVSDPEKFYIESHYYLNCTGDLQKARQVLELWTQTYPRDYTPRVDLSDIYLQLGQDDKALAEAREAVRLDANGVNYAEAVSSEISLNRFKDAKSMAQEAKAKGIDSPDFHFLLYQIAFLENDTAAMAQQIAWASGKPGSEDVLLGQESNTKAYFGQLKESRDLTRRAIASSMRAEEAEVTARYETDAALTEAVIGDTREARQRASAALALSKARDIEYEAALALAAVGDVVWARALTDDLAKRFPEDTIVSFNYLPALRAVVALTRGQPSTAIDLLELTVPYEPGNPHRRFALGAFYPVYVRGTAFLAERKGQEAAAEFQKITDHRGIVANSPIGALAYFQLGRAYTLSGDKSKARSSYQEFLNLWKNADPDLAALKQARQELTRLN